ncbi:MAG TPA: ThiF family adenylyltransferase, partial [Micromonosporaceae bacterium]|nr:ThiF family adenylyltransferase [Micromonosporaceae bacterium]
MSESGIVTGEWAVQRWHKPRVKPEHTPYRINGDRIRIGGAVYGIAAELGDPTGAIGTLLDSLDGTRTVDAVVAAVRARHPDQTPADIRQAICQFVESGYLEDAEPDPPQALSARERDRYERSRQFYRWVDLKPRVSTWDPQLRLRSAAVTLVGLGGTGGNAALALAASGVGTLHCVDCDTVELSNLNRQILYTEADIGRPKIDAAAERLRALNSDITVTTQHERIRGVAGFRDLVADCDVLLLCADSPGEIRAWANRACLDSGTPWVDSGYHGPRASVCVYLPGTGACYECLWLAEHERRRTLGAADPYTVDRRGSNAVCATSAGICGHLAAHAVIMLLTGISAGWPGRVRGVNLAVPDAQYLVADPPRPDCPACGSSSRACSSTGQSKEVTV